MTRGYFYKLLNHHQKRERLSYILLMLSVGYLSYSSAVRIQILPAPNKQNKTKQKEKQQQQTNKQQNARVSHNLTEGYFRSVSRE